MLTPSVARPANPFCHIVIPAPDLEKARLFYETVFGWQVQINSPGPRYWFFKSGNVGGAFDSRATPAAGSVRLVVQVSDMAETLALIAAHGGEIRRGREAIGAADPGFDAYFLDPNGNEIGIYSTD